MKFLDYIKLAFRNLTRRKLRTFLTVSAVVIGAIAVTTLVSIGQNVGLSFKEMINNLGILNMVTLAPNQDDETGGMINAGGGDTTGGKKVDDTTIAAVKKIKHVVDATPTASLWFESMQLKEGSGKKIRAGLLALDTETQAYTIDVSVGRPVNKNDMGKIVIGSGNLKALGYNDKPEEIVGKKVLLSAKGWYSGWGADVPKPPQNGDSEKWFKDQEQQKHQIEVEIVGVATPSGDDWQNYTNMEWGRAVQTRREWRQNEEKSRAWEEQQRSNFGGSKSSSGGKPDFYELVTIDELAKSGYNAVVIKVDDSKNTDAVAAEVKKLGYGASTAKEMIDEILRLIKILTNILAAIGGVSLIVAAIGIINTMAMAIFERRREIGVMRACGATRATVRRLFTFEAATIGLLGGSLGLLITYILALIGDWAAEKFGGLASIPIQTFVYFPYWLVFGVIGFTTTIGLFAGLYPALKAARLNPVEALKQQ
ncbi:MAG: ABC transporter permease [Patescibacteria group bacterium]|jgi:ABC-type antimicrobial peptide transport system permease subunit